MSETPEKEGLSISPKVLVAVMGAAAALGTGGGVAMGAARASAPGQDAVAVAVLTRRVDDMERTWEKRLDRIEANVALLVARGGACETKR